MVFIVSAKVTGASNGRFLHLSLRINSFDGVFCFLNNSEV